jgi:hypothetical protein
MFTSASTRSGTGAAQGQSYRWSRARSRGICALWPIVTRGIQRLECQKIQRSAYQSGKHRLYSKLNQSSPGRTTMSDAGPRMRGTIVKVPDASPGLVVVSGQQKQFTLEGVWRSPVAPAANMLVDVDLDASGSVAAVTVVDAQQRAREQMKQLSGVAQERGKEAADMAKEGVGALAARMGTVALASAVLVWIAWFFFPVASVDTGGGKISYSFWTLIGVDFKNLESLATGGSHGFFSLIGLIAIAVPFAAPFVRTTWSRYLYAAPLAYIVLGLIIMFGKEHSVFKQFAQNAGMNPFSWNVLMTIVLLIVAAVLAYQGVKKPANV